MSIKSKVPAFSRLTFIYSSSINHLRIPYIHFLTRWEGLVPWDVDMFAGCHCSLFKPSYNISYVKLLLATVNKHIITNDHGLVVVSGVTALLHEADKLSFYNVPAPSHELITPLHSYGT